MIETLIESLGTAFGQVVDLVSSFFVGPDAEGGVFGAFSDLSSKLFTEGA